MKNFWNRLGKWAGKLGFVKKSKYKEMQKKYVDALNKKRTVAFEIIEKSIKRDYVKKEDVKHTLDDIFGAEPLCQDLINLLESKEIAKKRRDSIFELKQAIIESLNLVK